MPCDMHMLFGLNWLYLTLKRSTYIGVIAHFFSSQRNLQKRRVWKYVTFSSPFYTNCSIIPITRLSANFRLSQPLGIQRVEEFVPRVFSRTVCHAILKTSWICEK